MKVFLVRHGESLPRENMSPSEGRNVGLSEFGKWQARIIGKCLRYYGGTKLLSSPLARARETASIFNFLALAEDARFEEFAPHPGQKGKEFKEAKRHAREDIDWAPEGGESVRGSADRFRDGVVTHARGEKSLIIVTHALVMQNFLLVHTPGGRIYPLDECSVTTLEYDPSGGGFRITDVNYTSVWMKLRQRLHKRLNRTGLWD